MSSPPARLSPRLAVLRGPTLVLLSSVAFGAMAAGVARLAGSVPAPTLSLVRAVVMLGLALPAASNGLGRALGPGTGWLWVRCIAGALAIVCYFSNLEVLGAGMAKALAGLSPLFVLGLGPVLLEERIGRRATLAVLATVVGVIVAAVARPPGALPLSALAIGLVGSAATAMAYLSLRKAAAEFPASLVLVCLGAATAVASAAVAALTGASAPPLDAWPATLGVAFAGTLGQALLTLGARHTPTPILNGLQGSALACIPSLQPQTCVVIPRHALLASPHGCSPGARRTQAGAVRGRARTRRSNPLDPRSADIPKLRSRGHFYLARTTHVAILITR